MTNTDIGGEVRTQTTDSAVTAAMARGRAFWSERLDLSERTLARAFQSGELAGFRVGDRVLHSPSHIEAWLRSKERNGGVAA
jgi:hypothetical protein